MHYEVLGGLHSLLAKSQLLAENPDNPFFKMCLCDVYVGLSDEETLRLSQRHNQTSHFTHSVTHHDLIGFCAYRSYVYVYFPLHIYPVLYTYRFNLLPLLTFKFIHGKILL